MNEEGKGKKRGAPLKRYFLKLRTEYRLLCILFEIFRLNQSIQLILLSPWIPRVCRVTFPLNLSKPKTQYTFLFFL